MLTMRSSLYGALSGLIFLGIGVIHGLAAHYGWVVSYGDFVVPEWQSLLIALLGFLMAFTAVRVLR